MCAQALRLGSYGEVNLSAYESGWFPPALSLPEHLWVNSSQETDLKVILREAEERNSAGLPEVKLLPAAPALHTANQTH